jgi:hypothetical protein
LRSTFSVYTGLTIRGGCAIGKALRFTKIWVLHNVVPLPKVSESQRNEMLSLRANFKHCPLFLSLDFSINDGSVRRAGNTLARGHDAILIARRAA